jgi:hypothetical protein
MSRAERLKSAPTCLLSRFLPPGCRSATGTAVESQTSRAPRMSNTELGSGEIVKFPLDGRARLRVATRRPRRSKNGTPEERAAKRAAAMGHEAATVLEMPRSEAASKAGPRPMTTEEFREAISQASPEVFEEVVRLMQACVEQNKNRRAGEALS